MKQTNKGIKELKEDVEHIDSGIKHMNEKQEEIKELILEWVFLTIYIFAVILANV